MGDCQGEKTLSKDRVGSLTGYICRGHLWKVHGEIKRENLLERNALRIRMET